MMHTGRDDGDDGHHESRTRTIHRDTLTRSHNTLMGDKGSKDMDSSGKKDSISHFEGRVQEYIFIRFSAIVFLREWVLFCCVIRESI